MLNPAEALQLVISHAQPLLPARLRVIAALGLRLAEDIVSDVDVPPHDKSLVDGYALRSADMEKGRADLRVVEEVFAGSVPAVTLGPGNATKIMTGAPIPAGADCVVMIERTEALDDGSRLGRVRIDDAKLAAGANIMRRASSVRRGTAVLQAGHRVRSVECGLLADFGRSQVLAFPRPRVNILATGSELVAVDAQPGPGQIRNSNGSLLAGCAIECGADVHDLGIAHDELSELRQAIARGLDADVLVLSGGVSVGDRDLTPQVLEDLGVRNVFHHVKLKPGKPVWFGVCETDERRSLVFGLPGNPVSSYVGFQWFVRPALDRLVGGTGAGLERLDATLTGSFNQHGNRATLRPAKLSHGRNGWQARLLEWEGSGDLAGLADADALAYFPAGDRRYAEGDAIEVYLIPSMPQFTEGEQREAGA